ncbi:ferric reductase-like transmembrane domain-containing protein [Psychromonas sp.]|uniref:ferredoxin reductase family protein n=1 Tax=Psychromonas sp. TaxID=1884585 RepID=UPI0039E24B4B
MTTQAEISTKSKAKFSFSLGKNHKLLIGYVTLLMLPFVAAQILDMDFKGWYVSLLSLINILAMMAFFIQFPLSSRIKQLPLFANIDWSMNQHKQIGKWLGIIFLLHPMLILAPRFFVSFDDGVISLIKTLTAPQMLTAIIAWVLLILWVLLSIYKDKLPMRYETWRLTHLLGFVAITILATLHITSVGRHGQFQDQFNLVWWGLCGFSLLMVTYNYLLKPTRLKHQPFTLKEVTKVSCCDWQVTVEKQQGDDFYFEAGQFVWLNTSSSVHGVNEHPFSIASCQNDLPKISFIIRELGDYTNNLDRLTLGQQVYIDGPYGSMSLNDSMQAKGITLIAGGVGIGPMLSLLRGLVSNRETRPVRLIYGNNSLEQMVLLDEIQKLTQQMPHFKLQLVCQQLVCQKVSEQYKIYAGVVDKQCIENNIDLTQADRWAVYLCGPKPMIVAVKHSLKVLHIPNSNIHYERLSF